jgi:Protein of unknown function (DUF2764).
MKNYEYIVASLPELVRDFGQHEMDFKSLAVSLKAQCPESDAHLVDWLISGLDGRHCSRLFYKRAASSDNRFIREFFDFDKKLREAKVAFLEGGSRGNGYEAVPEFERVFTVPNLIEREMKMDSLLWDKADELTLFSLFDIDVVLAFLVKAHIVCRWSSLDTDAGKQLFSKLVDEVRGTFSGVDYKPDND